MYKKKKKDAFLESVLRERIWFLIKKTITLFRTRCRKKNVKSYFNLFFFCSFHSKISLGLEFFEGWFEGCKEFDGARVGFHE